MILFHSTAAADAAADAAAAAAVTHTLLTLLLPIVSRIGFFFLLLSCGMDRIVEGGRAGRDTTTGYQSDRLLLPSLSINSSISKAPCPPAPLPITRRVPAAFIDRLTTVRR